MRLAWFGILVIAGCNSPTGARAPTVTAELGLVVRDGLPRAAITINNGSKSPILLSGCGWRIETLTSEGWVWAGADGFGGCVGGSYPLAAGQARTVTTNQPTNSTYRAAVYYSYHTAGPSHVAYGEPVVW